MTQPVTPPPPDANALVYKLAEAKKALDACVNSTKDARRKWKQALVFYEIDPMPELPPGAPVPPMPNTLPDLTSLGKNIRDAVRAEKTAQAAFDRTSADFNTHLVRKGAR